MAWTFNPFTGTLDVYGTGGGGSGSPGGAVNSVQYNAAGSFGGMAGTAWDDTNRALTITGATVTTSQPVLNMTQGWNDAAVTFTGLKFNVTDTASAGPSLLFDLQVGGASKFRVDKTGIISATGLSTTGGVGVGSTANINWGASLILTRAATATLQMGAADAAAPVAQTLQVQSVVAGTTNTAGANFTIKGSAGTGTGAGGSIVFQVAPAGASGTAQNAYATALTLNSAQQMVLENAGSASAPSITWSGSTSTGIFRSSAAIIDFSLNGTATMRVATNGVYVSRANSPLQVSATGNFSFSSNVAGSDAADLILARDAANTLALRNGTNAQTFNLYETYTDASNYSRLAVSYDAGTSSFRLAPQSLGTGTARPLTITTASGTWTFATNGATTFPAATLTVSNRYSLGGSTGIFALLTTNLASGAALEMMEQTAPAAPAANKVRIYAEDDGAGKTRLMALFPTGAAVQIAIEP